MCRWIAYLGSPLAVEDVLVRPDHSLIDQSLVARRLYLPGTTMASQFREHAFPTNGDGFGLAWSGRAGTLGQFRQVTPAWDSDNLRHLAAQIESPCFLAHVRAAPGGTIAEQNAHPFVHDGWMFQHNGEIGGFAALKRDLTMDVAPELYPHIRGTTDSEVCFFLALTYGLATDPVTALTRMVERVEAARAAHGVTAAFRGAFCASDGERLVVARWLSADAGELPPPSLFHSVGPETLHVGEGRTERLPDGAQLVVSEPLELHWSRRHWQEIPTATVGVFARGADPVFTALA
ncbi:class II glutamine amidotransferase [Microbacterium jiangjiandongii]|uniref:class II glutamine amidotransferase n=1 Tax=Microbacterium jiangjiandongii TaxID=3049071 RepID=UPI00214BAA08|nr:class II glutamine amidotransferase [Microbacterium sp. zg.Y843]MCR2815642.1 class II glutamine amidotransferase [Microbacterium sp. zg.Y843]